MKSQTLAKPENKKSTTLLSRFVKKPSSRMLAKDSLDEIHEKSNPNFGHNFGDVQVESPAFKQSCPISLSGSTHCPFGGACHTCAPTIQTKLKIGQPNDKFEQEADRVAEQVMRMPDPRVQGKGCVSCNDMDEDEQIQAKSVAGRITPLVQRQVGEEALQTKEISEQIQGVTQDVQLNLNNLRGSGKPLPESERSFFEPRFGYDFSQVRVHSDARAAESVRLVNSRSFAVGRHVVFGTGEYAPETREGRRLIAHELTHTIQQSHGVQSTDAGRIGDSYGWSADATVMRKKRTPRESMYLWVPFDGKGGWDAAKILSHISQNESTSTAIPEHLAGAGSASDRYRCGSNTALSVAIAGGPMQTIELCKNLRARIDTASTRKGPGNPTPALCARARAQVSRIIRDIFYGMTGSASPGHAGTMMYRDFDLLAHWIYVFSYDPGDDRRKKGADTLSEHSLRYRSTEEVATQAEWAGYERGNLLKTLASPEDLESLVGDLSTGEALIVGYKVHFISFFRNKTDRKIYCYDGWGEGKLTIFAHGSYEYERKINEIFSAGANPRAFIGKPPNLEMYAPDLSEGPGGLRLSH